MCQNHVGKKVRKTVYFQYSGFQKGQLSFKILTQTDDTRTCCKSPKKSYTKFWVNVSRHVGVKCGKLCISSFLSSKKGHNSYKNWLKIDGTHTCTKVHEMKVIYKFSAQYGKYVGEKCRKLCIFSILSSKRDITRTKFTKNWWHSNLF